jgi:hypothetical protein
VRSRQSEVGGGVSNFAVSVAVIVFGGPAFNVYLPASFCGDIRQNPGRFRLEKLDSVVQIRPEFFRLSPDLTTRRADARRRKMLLGADSSQPVDNVSSFHGHAS